MEKHDCHAHMTLAGGMKTRHIWSVIDICGTVFFKNVVGWVCELSDSPGYQWALPYQEYNTILESHWRPGDKALLFYLKEMQVIKVKNGINYRSVLVNPWIHLLVNLLI